MQFRLRTLLVFMAVCAAIIAVAKFLLMPAAPALELKPFLSTSAEMLHVPLDTRGSVQLYRCGFHHTRLQSLKISVIGVRDGEAQPLGESIMDFWDKELRGEGTFYVTLQTAPPNSPDNSSHFSGCGIVIDMSRYTSGLKPFAIDPTLLMFMRTAAPVEIPPGRELVLWSFYWRPAPGGKASFVVPNITNKDEAIEAAKQFSDGVAVLVVVEAK